MTDMIDDELIADMSREFDEGHGQHTPNEAANGQSRAEGANLTDVLGIADRLRAWIPDGDGYNSEYANTLAEAADEIERLHDALTELARVEKLGSGMNHVVYGHKTQAYVAALLGPNGSLEGRR